MLRAVPDPQPEDIAREFSREVKRVAAQQIAAQQTAARVGIAKALDRGAVYDWLKAENLHNLLTPVHGGLVKTIGETQGKGNDQAFAAALDLLQGYHRAWVRELLDKPWVNRHGGSNGSLEHALVVQTQADSYADAIDFVEQVIRAYYPSLRLFEW